MRSAHIFSLACILALGFVAAGASAQDEPTSPPTNLDLPFLEPQEMGARWAGMGGACLGIVDDGTAAWWNPAGLAMIRRIEIMGTFTNKSVDIRTDWAGRETDGSLTATRLDNAVFSYPFPTYRGSLVASAGVFRTTSSDQYLERRAGGEYSDYRDIEEREVILSAWSGAFGVQVSPNAFVGAEAHFYTGSLKFNDRLYPWADCPPPGARFSQDGDLSGYGGTVGMLYVPHPMISLGMALKTPQRVTFDGTEAYTSSSPTGCTIADQATKYNIDLPYSLGIGFGIMPTNFVIDVDLIYTDWHQLDYPGGIRDEEGNYIFDRTTDIRAGVEYSLPFAPFRVRAGYAYVPLQLNIFSIERDRTQLSFGAGAIVEGSLTADVAWQRTSFERKSVADQYSEERTVDRIILSFAYRF